jgi:hypothetical protein
MTTSPAAFRIEIASVPDRDDLVAEVWCGAELFAELRHEAGDVSVQLYCPSRSGQWDMRLADLIAVLDNARERLGPAHADGHDDEDLVR